MEPYLPNYLKGKNRRLVFDLLRERGQMSRAEITRDTGMSFPTAMKVVDAFWKRACWWSWMKPAPRLAPGGKDACCALIRELPRCGRGMRGPLRPAWGWRIWRAACRRGKPSSWAISHARGTSPPRGGHPAHVRCGKRRSCSGRVHRLSRQPGPGRGGHRQLRGHGHQAAHLLCAVVPAFWREVELPVYLENDANLACEGEAFLRRGAGGAANTLHLVHRLGLRRAVRLDGKTAPRRALPRGRGRRDASAAGAGCARAQRRAGNAGGRRVSGRAGAPLRRSAAGRRTAGRSQRTGHAGLICAAR